MSQLQTEKEECVRIANDYGIRFSDIEKNYRFNHEYGDWCDKRRNGKQIVAPQCARNKKKDRFDGDTLIARFVGLVSDKETN